MTWQVKHEPAKHRYAIYSSDNELAGFAAYEPTPEGRNFNHTVVDPAYRGQGLSQKLIAKAVTETEDGGLEVQATCSAVQHWLAKREEEQAS